MFEVNLKNKKLDERRLIKFGFERTDDGYRISADLVGGQFKMNILVTTAGAVYTQVVDKNTDEEYVLHQVAGSEGAFVGRVKEEYDAVVDRISRECFVTEVFKSEYTKRVLEYAGEKYGDEPEFLWEKFDDNAVLRRKDTGKWYAVILTIAKRKLGIESDDIVEIIDMRIAPEKIDELIDNERYFRGWHMNKKRWFTICLDGSVDVEEICRRMDESYMLAV